MIRMLVAVAIAGAAFTVPMTIPTSISTLPAIPAAVADATQTCSAFGGVEEQDGICRWRESNANATLNLSFPVDYPDETAVTNFITQTRDDFLEAAKDRDPSRPQYALEIQANRDASDTTRSAVFEVYQNEGGAHPNVWYKTFNYDLAGKRPIKFGDLFAPGSQPLNAIFPVVQQDLAAQLGMADPVSASDGLDPAHYQNFTITPVHLVFFFDRGEILSGAAGARTVYVPRSAIPPLKV